MPVSEGDKQEIKTCLFSLTQQIAGHQIESESW